MRGLAAALLLVVAACEGTPSSQLPPTSSSSTTTTAPTALVPTTRPSPACLTGELAFVEVPGELPISLPEGEPDAGHISGWSLVEDGACDRLTISLATEGGAPARVAGEVKASLLGTEGVLRLTFDPHVQTSAVVDQVFEGSFVSRGYVVRSLDGSLFVDLHLSRPASARVFVDRSPAVVTIDLAEGSTLFVGPAAAEDAVIIAPADPRQSYPLELSGYMRTPDIDILLTGEGVEPEPVDAELADGQGLWAAYEAVIDDGPIGIVTLEVGTATRLLELS